MFIIWGWGKRTVALLGTLGQEICPNCHNMVEMGYLRIRTWFTLFFIPVIPYSIKYIMCPVCSKGVETDGNLMKSVETSSSEPQLLGPGRALTALAGRRRKIAIRAGVAAAILVVISIVVGLSAMHSGGGSQATSLTSDPVATLGSDASAADVSSLNQAMTEIGPILDVEKASMATWNSALDAVGGSDSSTWKPFERALAQRTSDAKTELRRIKAITPPSGAPAGWVNIVACYRESAAHYGRFAKLWKNYATGTQILAESKRTNAKTNQLWNAWRSAMMAEADRLGVDLPYELVAAVG